jgi:hypothetical protein
MRVENQPKVGNTGAGHPPKNPERLRSNAQNQVRLMSGTGSRARLRIQREREQFLQYCGTREPDEYHIRKAAE